MILRKDTWMLGSVVLLLLYFGLVAVASRIALILLVATSCGLIYLARRSTTWYFRVLFFSLPLLGEFQRRMNLGPVTLVVLFIFSGVIGLGIKNRDSFSFPNSPRLPTVVWAIALIFSLFFALVKTSVYYFKSHDLHAFAHQMGWVWLFFMIPLSGYVLFSVLRSHNTNDQARIEYFISLMLGMVISSFVGLYQYLSRGGEALMQNGLPHIDGRFPAMFIDANAMGTVAGLLIPIWVALLFETGKKRLILLGPSLIILLVIAGSRSGAMVSFLGTLALLCLIPSKIKKWILLLTIVLGLGGLAMVVKWDTGNALRTTRLVRQMTQSMTDHAKGPLDPIIYDRFPLWKCGWITFKHHWFLGVGLGRYLIDMPKLADEIGRVFNDNSCNMYLHVAAEQGIIGLFAFITLLGGFLYSCARRIGKNPTSFPVAGFSVIVGLLVAFVFGAHLLNPEVNAVFWTILALSNKDPF